MSNFKTHKLTNAQKAPVVSSEKSIKKSKFFRKFIAILFFTVSFVFLIAMGMQAMGSIKLGDTSINLGTISFTGTEERAIAGTTNVLIAGIGGQGHEGSNLTDSIMLASINPETNYVTLLSIPRDLFVAYPKGYGTAGRINALYAMGKANGQGIELLAKKVSEITGQPIHHYVVIDFRGFKNVVDALGGIEIDVPKDLYDREYPNENWGYEVFSVKSGLQVFDGEKALKYVRSRHSTSDFDRSERQQLVIKAMKDKALSLGIVTNPLKIKEVYESAMKNIDTNFTLGEITKYALGLKDIENSHINVYNLSYDCSGAKCAAGAYLYAPSREYFGGASALIPENASATRLSYYDDIRRFVEFVFTFPNLRNEKLPIVFVTKKGKTQEAKSLAMALGKMGIQFDTQGAFIESTGSITTSHVNIYWNKEFKIGTDPNGTAMQALKKLEEKIPYTVVERNEFVTNAGPKIEIVLGDDKNSYFQFAKPAYYLPYLESQANTGTNASGKTLTGGVSGEAKTPSKAPSTPTKTPQNSTTKTAPQQTPKQTSPYEIQPGEWENF